MILHYHFLWFWHTAIVRVVTFFFMKYKDSFFISRSYLPCWLTLRRRVSSSIIIHDIDLVLQKYGLLSTKKSIGTWVMILIHWSVSADPLKATIQGRWNFLFSLLHSNGSAAGHKPLVISRVTPITSALTNFINHCIEGSFSTSLRFWDFAFGSSVYYF